LFNQDITFYQLPPTAEGSKNLLNVRQARVWVDRSMAALCCQSQIWRGVCY
jgi:hypothetical protein